MDAERRPHGLVRVDAAPRGGRRDVGERRAVGGVERKCVGKGHVGGGREGAERVAGADGKASSIICTEPDLVLGHHRCSHASRHEEPAGGARIDSLRDAAELDPGRTEDTGVCPAVPDVDALLPEERVAVVEAHGWLPAPEPVSYPQGVIAAQPQEERKPVLLPVAGRICPQLQERSLVEDLRAGGVGRDRACSRTLQLDLDPVLGHSTARTPRPLPLQLCPGPPAQEGGGVALVEEERTVKEEPSRTAGETGEEVDGDEGVGDGAD
mmetsp:Transcript_1385/g.3012  ORF Transcript_1385/g.3012 Transcript_1385/m.3012 type:complete len:267 (+) Transcript_1385:218-1018(+)